MRRRDTDRILTLATGPVGIAEYGAPDGEPVLALHGAPACRLMFAVADAPARAAGLRLYAPDRPGYGLTPIDAAPSLANRAEGLERVADALGLDRFAILAVSGGAPYGAALAARLGKRVRVLAFVSPMGPLADFLASVPEGRREVPFLQRRFFLHLPRRSLLAPASDLLARAFLASPRGFSGVFPRLAGDPDAHVLRKPHVREAMLAMTREALRRGAAGGVADLRIFSTLWNVELSLVTAPAVMWQGTADRIVPVAAALHLARVLPACRLITLDGAGHFWVFDHIEEVCRRLAGMLAAERASGAP